VGAWRALGIDARLMAPDAAVEALGPGDVALLRIDVSAALDGFESRLERVPDLRFHRVRILNSPWALIGAHDELETARRLREAQIPHPRTRHALRGDSDLDISLPVVVKPRHGSWGPGRLLLPDGRRPYGAACGRYSVVTGSADRVHLSRNSSGHRVVISA
jgi:hypothetical protein